MAVPRKVYAFWRIDLRALVTQGNKTVYSSSSRFTGKNNIMRAQSKSQFLHKQFALYYCNVFHYNGSAKTMWRYKGFCSQNLVSRNFLFLTKTWILYPDDCKGRFLVKLQIAFRSEHDIFSFLFFPPGMWKSSRPLFSRGRGMLWALKKKENHVGGNIGNLFTVYHQIWFV